MENFEFIAFDERGCELTAYYNPETDGRYGTLGCAKKILHRYNKAEQANGYVACVGEYRENDD